MKQTKFLISSLLILMGVSNNKAWGNIDEYRQEMAARIGKTLGAGSKAGSYSKAIASRYNQILQMKKKKAELSKKENDKLKKFVKFKDISDIPSNYSGLK